MKAVVAAFNQEKALVGAFSVITNLRMELFEALLVTPPSGGDGAVLLGPATWPRQHWALLEYLQWADKQEGDKFYSPQTSHISHLSTATLTPEHLRSAAHRTGEKIKIHLA